MATSSSKVLSFEARLATVFIIQSAALSALFVLLFLSYVVYNALRNAFRPPKIGSAHWHFLRTPVDHYLLFLLLCDLLMAAGGLMNGKWVHDAALPLTTTPFCTAQGAIKQTANLGVALASTAIAVHTFLVLFLRWKAPPGRWLPTIVLACIATFIILVTVIASQTKTDPPFYGPSSYWCWINKKYVAERVGLEYAILWIAAAVNIILYVPLFFCLRGNIVVDPAYTDQHHQKPRFKMTWNPNATKYAWAKDRGKREEAMTVARQMLAYPIAYIILIVPMSVSRWIEFYHPNVRIPPGATAFAGVCFSASGFVNVLLYVITRPALLPSFKRFRGRDDQSEDGIEGPPMVGEGEVSTTQVVNSTVVSEMQQTGSFSTIDRHPHRIGNSTDGGHGRSPTRSHGRDRLPKVIPSSPMLSDEDDDDGEKSPWSPTSTAHSRQYYGKSLHVPGHGLRGDSWVSEASKSSAGRSSSGVGYDLEKSLPYLPSHTRQ